MAGTTLVPSTWSFNSCSIGTHRRDLEPTTHWLFQHTTNCRRLWEIRVISCITVSRANSCMVLTRLRDREPAQCFRKAGANPCRGGWMAHSVEPRARTTVEATEWSRARWSKWRTGKGRMRWQSSPDEWSLGKGWPKGKQCQQ